MSEYKQTIENYGQDVSDFDCSPFESIRMFHERSELQKVFDQLTFQEKVQLAQYDLVLIQNAEKMVEHVRIVYDFSLSTQPLDEWWWHLDKVASGELSLDVISFKDKVI